MRRPDADAARRQAAYLEWAALPAEQLLERLDSGLEGLAGDVAEARLRVEGPNLLPVPHGPGAVRMVARQLVHFFALMLWAAAALAFAAGAPQLRVAIVIVIVVNAIFGFVQEYRVGQAVKELSALLPSTVTAIRDGRQAVVPAADVVRADVLVLREGDHVPADARLLRSDGLTVDDSTLAGESVPVVKVAPVRRKEPATPARPAAGADQQDRALHALQHLESDAAQQPAAKVGSASRAKHDQVGAVLCGRRGDLPLPPAHRAPGAARAWR